MTSKSGYERIQLAARIKSIVLQPIKSKQTFITAPKLGCKLENRLNSSFQLFTWSTGPPVDLITLSARAAGDGLTEQHHVLNLVICATGNEGCLNSITPTSHHTFLRLTPESGKTTA